MVTWTELKDGQENERDEIVKREDAEDAGGDLPMMSLTEVAWCGQCESCDISSWTRNG